MHTSKLRKIIKVAENAERISARLAVELPRHGVAVQQHHSGLTILGTVFRPFSLAWGQHVRIDFKSIDRAHTEVMIESAFPFPRIDVSHENEKTLAMIETFVLARELDPEENRAVA